MNKENRKAKLAELTMDSNASKPVGEPMKPHGKLTPSEDPRHAIKKEIERWKSTNDAYKEMLEELKKEKRDKSEADDVSFADVKDPQEYAHKVFEMLAHNIVIEGLDE